MIRPLSEAPRLEPSDPALLNFDQQLPGLFHAVAANRDHSRFPDGKMLADAEPVAGLGQIIAAHAVESRNPNFDPLAFWGHHFKVPDQERPVVGDEQYSTVDDYISGMWDVLTYHVPESRGTLIGTRYPNLKPGQRFGEACYWDLGFGVSGLLAEARYDSGPERSKKENLALGVARNVADQIYQYGYVPNGFRTYYHGRSQPPVFTHMIKEMADYFDDRYPHLVEEYLPAVVKEYNWWMNGEDTVGHNNGPTAYDRVVRMPDGSILNRHWDANDTPRPESYQEDLETVKLARGVDPREIFRHLRAGAESGRDFTARFFTDPERLETIHTADFVTPELNSLLYEYERFIADAYWASGRSVQATEFDERAANRRDAVNTYLWNEGDGTYYDYDFVKGEQSTVKSTGMAYPVARGITSPEKATRVAQVLKHPSLLKAGGFVSSNIESDEQWDSPNGWSPDQLIASDALIAAGEYPTAALAIKRWLHANNETYRHFGVLMEKNNVVDIDALPGGGEYPVQQGFLWTNGVHRILQARLAEDPRLRQAA